MSDDHEKRQMTLLEKLASSFSRKDGSDAAPVQRRAAPEPVSENRRPEGRGPLDPGSRPARHVEAQDDLEIPAFLRRQA